MGGRVNSPGAFVLAHVVDLVTLSEHPHPAAMGGAGRRARRDRSVATQARWTSARRWPGWIRTILHRPIVVRRVLPNIERRATQPRPGRPCAGRIATLLIPGGCDGCSPSLDQVIRCGSYWPKTAPIALHAGGVTGVPTQLPMAHLASHSGVLAGESAAARAAGPTRDARGGPVRDELAATAGPQCP